MAALAGIPARWPIVTPLQRTMLFRERVGMLGWMQSAGSMRLKILLLIVCIAAAAVTIYLLQRPPRPARLAPGYVPEFGRGAARYSDRPVDEERSSSRDNDSRQERP